MKVLSIVNVSNADDLNCDSGIIFQRILASSLSQDLDFVLVGPDVQAFHDLEIDAKKLYMNLGASRYSSRFSFDWPEFEKIIQSESPDVIFNNQVEITAAIRSLLVTLDKSSTKLISYCHYPAIHGIDDNAPILDSSLNHGNLGLPIVLDIISAMVTADKFIIQSQFAKRLLVAAANYYNINLPANRIIVIPPPLDPILKKPVSTKPPSVYRVVYNHRLYATYGTEEFLQFMDSSRDLGMELLCLDPMPRRSKVRRSLSGSPHIFRQKLMQLPKARLIDGNIDRESYGEVLSTARFAFAAFRRACVWSMSSVDCMSRGIPVVAPNYAVYPELIPRELLFNDLEEARQISRRLLEDDDFWLTCANKCHVIAQGFSPEIITSRLHEVFIGK